MVTGIDKFQKYFAGHEGHYAIIGGAACDLMFDEAGLDFRATKDIDMVLCVEVVDAAFGTAFKEFLDAGGYQARERSTGEKEFYRFHKPSDQDFPFMIELFSRKPARSTFRKMQNSPPFRSRKTSSASPPFCSTTDIMKRYSPRSERSRA